MKLHSPFFGLDRTGGTLVLLRYLGRLRTEGHQISITTLGRAGDPRFVDPPVDADTTYLGLRGTPYKAVVRAMPGRWPFPWLEQRRLQAAAPRADLHIVGYSLALDPVLPRHEPVQYHVQHFEPLIVQGTRSERIARRSYLAATYTTANCTWVAEQVAEAGGHVRGIVNPGFESSAFDFHPPGDRDQDGVVRVLTLGKAVDWKGLTDVVAATEELARRLPGRTVELHSYGPDEPKNPGGQVPVVHHGFVDAARLGALHRTASVAVTGSWYESFPLPPLEAMAAGTPVVTTRIGTEDYARHEENCLVAPSKDPSGLADAIEALVTDPALQARLAEVGRTTAARFTWAAAEDAFIRAAAAAAAGD